jgi:hypothetical protein
VTDMYNLLLLSQAYDIESEMFGACILLQIHHINAGVLSRTYEV